MATAVTSNPPILDAEVVIENSLVHQPITIQPIMNVELAMQRLKEFQQFVDAYLKDGEDYGKIPGIKKSSLWKSGAEKLCEIYGLSDDYVEMSKTIDWEKGLFDYEYKCVLSRGGHLVGTGLGSCSSYESKYRWRQSARACPSCHRENTIIKGKDEYGGGWLCFAKKGGCGAKFVDGDQSIEAQVTEKVLNPDMADVKNTIMKMAKKRSKVDAVIAVTRSSGIFTQDVEDVGPANAYRDEAPAWDDIGAEPSKPPQTAHSNGNGNGHGQVNYISERDRQALYSLIGRNGRSHDQFVAYLRNTHNATPTTIPTSAFADVCLWAKGAA